MKVNSIVTTKVGDKKVTITLSKTDEQHLLQFALNTLIDKGAITIVQEREQWLLKIPVEGHG